MALATALVVGLAASARPLTIEVVSGIILSAENELVDGKPGLVLACHQNWSANFGVVTLSAAICLLVVSVSDNFWQNRKIPA